MTSIRRLATLLAGSGYDSILSLSASKMNDEFLQEISSQRLRIICETEFTDSQAACFAEYNGSLALDVLTSLSEVAAESLSNHKGGLSLDGLTNLSDSPGHIALADRSGHMSFRGLTSLPGAAAECLNKHGHFYPNSAKVR